jgi:hypothetical protein
VTAKEALDAANAAAPGDGSAALNRSAVLAGRVGMSRARLTLADGRSVLIA